VSDLFELDPEVVKAKKAAFTLLGRRAYTRKEIRGKLIKRGFEDGVIEKTIAILERLRVIDDRDFASRFVQEKLRLKPAGKPVLQRDLRRRGIEASVIEEVLAEEFGEIDLEAVAFRLLCSRRSRYLQLDRKKAWNRMYAFLASRGFSPDVARPVTARAWDCIENGIEDWEEE
jgi:regulatory protein